MQISITAKAERMVEAPNGAAHKPEATYCRAVGYTLFETVIVLAILSLLVTIVSVSIFGRIKHSRLDADVGRFVRTLRLAAEEAVMRGQTLSVVIDIYDGYYTVYEDLGEEGSGESAEPLIDRQGLYRCWFDEVELEDGSRQYSGQVILHATPIGWSGSLLFRLIDREDRERYIRCDRFTTRVTLANQPLYLPEPQMQLSLSSSL